MIEELLQTLRRISIPVFCALLLGVVALAYRVPWASGRLLHYDDPILIEPLAGMSSFTQWIDQYRDNQIWDVQPVRDFSLWIDAKLTELIGHETFHLTNLLIWIASCFLIRWLLIRVSGKPGVSSFLALIFAVWPTFVTSVALASSRRHLLCFFFILAATLVFLRAQPRLRARDVALLCLLYSLSVLSHGISILWPFWAVSYLAICRWPLQKSQAKETLGLSLKLTPLFALGALFAGLTMNYYHHRYLLVTGKPAFYATAELGDQILALGRSFFQILFPMRFSLSYFRGSPLNLLGLPLGFGVLLLLKKRIGYRSLLTWVTLLALSLVPALSRNIFVYDLYLLIAGFSFLMMISLALPESRREYPVIGTALLVLALARTTFVANHFSSALELWGLSWRNEPSQWTEANYAFYLFDRDPAAASALVRNLEEARCDQDPCFVASAMAAYYAPWPAEQKDVVLRRLSSQLFFGDLVYSAFLLQYPARHAEAGKLLEGIYQDPIFIRLFASLDNQLIRDVRQRCHESPLKGCQLFLARHHTKMKYY